MAWFSSPLVLLKVQAKKHIEELLPNCECLYQFIISHMLKSYCFLYFTSLYSNLQRTERVDDGLVNEMLRSVSFSYVANQIYNVVDFLFFGLKNMISLSLASS